VCKSRLTPSRLTWNRIAPKRQLTHPRRWILNLQWRSVSSLNKARYLQLPSGGFEKKDSSAQLTYVDATMCCALKSHVSMPVRRPVNSLGRVTCHCSAIKIGISKQKFVKIKTCEGRPVCAHNPRNQGPSVERRIDVKRRSRTVFETRWI
jgi:hypothetical protein